MTRGYALLALAIVGWAATAPAVSARALPASRPATTAATGPASRKITVAVLDFKSDTPANPDLGQQIADTLALGLSGGSTFAVVDRSSLSRTLQEHELGLTGLVTAETAVKVGKLVGARLLVTGRVFPLDTRTFITVKIIGVETSLVEGVVVKGEAGANLDALVMQVSEQVEKKLAEAGPRLVAADDAAFDPLPGLKQKLQTRRLPKIAVRIPERHLPQAAAPVADPAAESELRKCLVDAGFTVVDGDEKDWARAGVEVVVTGEAFSEPAGRIGNLVSCGDRVEIKVTTLKDNTLQLVDRDQNRAVDLAENLAAKAALQKSGRVLALRLLDHFAQTLPAK